MGLEILLALGIPILLLVGGMLFLNRLSDAFDETREGVIQYYLGKGKTKEQAEVMAKERKKLVRRLTEEGRSYREAA